MANSHLNTNIFTSILLILFIGLKLTGYIDWSWWWVLSPFWIPILLLAILGIYYFYHKFIKQ